MYNDQQLISSVCIFDLRRNYSWFIVYLHKYWIFLLLNETTVFALVTCDWKSNQTSLLSATLIWTSHIDKLLTVNSSLLYFKILPLWSLLHIILNKWLLGTDFSQITTKKFQTCMNLFNMILFCCSNNLHNFCFIQLYLLRATYNIQVKEITPICQKHHIRLWLFSVPTVHTFYSHNKIYHQFLRLIFNSMAMQLLKDNVLFRKGALKKLSCKTSQICFLSLSTPKAWIFIVHCLMVHSTSAVFNKHKYSMCSSAMMTYGRINIDNIQK